MKFDERNNRYFRDPYVTLINTDKIITINSVNGDNCRIFLENYPVIITAESFSDIASKLNGGN